MTGFVVFGSILVLLVTVIIWSAVRAGRDASTRLNPEERRDAAIEALREVEFEYRTGKLSQEEYGELRRRIEREAIAARDDTPLDLCRGCGTGRDGDAAFCASCGQAF
ncbi:MAG: hypothetical protein OEU54_13005 [Gemmatimonadota bacterium]|nr:hypothetical protein [Gemmatimonadota bacterium]